MLQEHSAIRWTFIKLPFVFKTFVLSIFEWPLKTGFIVILGPEIYSNAHLPDNFPCIAPYMEEPRPVPE